MIEPLKHMQEAEDILVNLHKLVFSFNHVANHILKSRLDISYSQFITLLVIYRNSTVEESTDTKNLKQCKITYKKLAQKLGETEAALSKQIESLTNRGFLYKYRDQVNQRKIIIETSQAGKDKLKKSLKLIKSVYTSFFGILGEVERRDFHKKLDKLVFNL